MPRGICKLTRKSGKFVRSHLIPQAFTKPSVPGAFFISGGPGLRPRRRWSSWYDEQLVIEEGEDILAKYDDWAIRELRRLQLVWSGWDTTTASPTSGWIPVPASLHLHDGFGLRALECANPDKLRLFFLSLLWRAAATNQPDFHDVYLELDELELLRTMIVSENPEPFDFYPTTLLQIVTRGPPHNLGPIPDDFGYTAFRFYFDGLIAHMHRNLRGRDIETWQSIVGTSSLLVVQTQTFEKSFQLANIIRHQVEATQQCPEVIKKLTSPPSKKRR